MADQDRRIEQGLGAAYQRIGRLLSENMGAGITEGSDAAKKAMDQLNQELLESQQTYLNEKARIDKETEAAEEAKYRRDYQNRLRKAKTAEQAEIIRQNEQLRLQKKANKEYLEALETHLATVEEKVKAQKTIIINEFNEIAQGATKSLEELEKAKAKMADKLSSYGGLFDTRTITFLNSGPNGSKEVFEDTILDLSQERAELEQYARLLQELQSRGDIPRELFQAVRELSVKDAIRYQEALLAMSDGERMAYIADWEAIQRLSKATAQMSYAEETKDVLATVERELAAWYGTIPDGFFKEGSLSAEAFGEGFIKKLSILQETLQTSVQSLLSGGGVQGLRLGSVIGAGTIQNIENTMTYVLNSAGETVSQQLRSARAHAAVEQLREG